MRIRAARQSFVKGHGPTITVSKDKRRQEIRAGVDVRSQEVHMDSELGKLFGELVPICTVFACRVCVNRIILSFLGSDYNLSKPRYLPVSQATK